MTPIALLLPLLAAAPASPPAPIVIRHGDVPLYDVYAWERWGNFINAQADGKTEIPYDAAHLSVKVYTFPTGEIRAIRFPNGVRTHRHVNQTDTVLYGWQAHRVQFVNDLATVAGPGDFALHQKGVYHSGEEIRRGGGIDLEFAFANPGRHNHPAAFWSLAREHPVQPAARWRGGKGVEEAIGPAAMVSAPGNAVRYRVRVADLPGYPARELYLAKGAVLPPLRLGRDVLMFVLTGRVRITASGQSQEIGVEDAARIPADRDVTIEALEDAMLTQAPAPLKAVGTP